MKERTRCDPFPPYLPMKFTLILSCLLLGASLAPGAPAIVLPHENARRIEVLFLGAPTANGPGHDPIDAWEVAASTRSDMTVTFAVAKADRRLLTVEVGDVRSVLGGDCKGLLG